MYYSLFVTAHPEKPWSYIVYGGKEPLSFTNRFAVWMEHEEAALASSKVRAICCNVERLNFFLIV